MSIDQGHVRTNRPLRIVSGPTRAGAFAVPSQRRPVRPTQPVRPGTSVEVRTIEDGKVVVARGEFDVLTEHLLRHALVAAFGPHTLTLDLSGVTFLSAGAARSLVAAEQRQRRRAGTFAVRRASGPVRKLLMLAGMPRPTSPGLI